MRRRRAWQRVRSREERAVAAADLHDPGGGEPRRLGRAVDVEEFEPLGARSGSGMALGKQTSCFFG